MNFPSHLQLGKLIMLYDDNGITIDGEESFKYFLTAQKIFLK
jgi:transketolase